MLPTHSILTSMMQKVYHSLLLLSLLFLAPRDSLAVSMAAASKSKSNSFASTYNSTPNITSISPTEGPTVGGNTITIQGTNFGSLQNGGSVAIGGLACSNYVWTDTEISCTVPAGTAGPNNLVLTNGGGFISNIITYTYNPPPQITSVSPASGSVNGGNTITLSGSNFGALQNGGSVSIGGLACSNYVWSDIQVTCTVPASTAGERTFTLTTGNGFSSNGISYTYYDVPNITGISPSDGPISGGNTVTIQGTNFGANQNAGSVTIGGNLCTNFSWTDTEVSCTVPAGTAGNQALVLTNGGGFVSNTINYFYNSLLPVKLVEFTASLRGRKVALWWATASEQNNSGFTVERSGDGRQWNSIDFVPGMGNSNARAEYDFEDTSPLVGINHYRLRQVDFDGTTSYSEIRQVWLAGKGEFTAANVYPNPSTGVLRVDFERGLPANGSLELFDLRGRFLQSFALGVGVQRQELDLSALDKGVYVLQVTCAGKRSMHRIVLQ